MEKPDFVTDDMLVFLDALRESGITNMFMAGPYIRSEYAELSRKEVQALLLYWMETFGTRHTI